MSHEFPCQYPIYHCTCTPTITNYKQAIGKRYVGYVGIGFRTDKVEYDINKNLYLLNSCNDGWFRRDNSCGITSSHGLMIRNIKITSRKPQLVGDFICHKAEIVYETNDFDPEIVTDKFWVFVHKQFDIQEVLDYIHAHLTEWRA